VTRLSLLNTRLRHNRHHSLRTQSEKNGTLEARALVGTDGAAFPFWSPDSRFIGFFTRSKLKRIAISGGPAEEVADVVLGRGGAWSATGIIVFCPRPVGVLYRIGEPGGTPQPVTSLDASRSEMVHSFPHFLPDGRQFLYLASSTRRGDSSIPFPIAASSCAWGPSKICDLTPAPPSPALPLPRRSLAA
jgi:hypothetical protein